MRDSNVYTMEGTSSDQGEQLARDPGSDNLLETIGWGAGWIAGLSFRLGASARTTTAAAAARPLAKNAIKKYFFLADRAKVAAALAVEQAQDLFAEAQAEYDANCTETKRKSI